MTCAGTLIRRHRIPRPPPHDDTFYTVEDFNVGKEIVLYSRTFKLTACDQFTENFLGKLGVKVYNPSSIPEDPYMNHRKAVIRLLDFFTSSGKPAYTFMAPPKR